MIVPDVAVRGGIASVTAGYRGSVLEQHHEIDYVESYCDGSKRKKLLKAISGYCCFIRQLLHNRPDIVHIHSSFGPSFYRKLPFIYLSRWIGIPVVNHIHGAEFDTFYEKASTRKRKLVQKVYGKCSRLIVLSKEWKEALAQIVPAQKIDIVENPLNLEIVELEAAQIARTLPDVDIAAINGNYAVDAGLKLSDALAVEAADSLAAQTYGNVLVVKEGNEDSEVTKALVEVLLSEEVKEYINATYEGAVVPVF